MTFVVENIQILQEETPFWITPEFEVERVEENFSLAIIFSS